MDLALSKLVGQIPAHAEIALEVTNQSINRFDDDITRDEADTQGPDDNSKRLYSQLLDVQKELNEVKGQLERFQVLIDQSNRERDSALGELRQAKGKIGRLENRVGDIDLKGFQEIRRERDQARSLLAIEKQDVLNRVLERDDLLSKLKAAEERNDRTERIHGVYLAEITRSSSKRGEAVELAKREVLARKLAEAERDAAVKERVEKDDMTNRNHQLLRCQDERIRKDYEAYARLSNRVKEKDEEIKERRRFSKKKQNRIGQLERENVVLSEKAEKAVKSELAANFRMRRVELSTRT
jgi:hypothetical protein